MHWLQKVENNDKEKQECPTSNEYISCLNLQCIYIAVSNGIESRKSANGHPSSSKICRNLVSLLSGKPPVCLFRMKRCNRSLIGKHASSVKKLVSCFMFLMFSMFFLPDLLNPTLLSLDTVAQKALQGVATSTCRTICRCTDRTHRGTELLEFRYIIIFDIMDWHPNKPRTLAECREQPQLEAIRKS